jgi:P-type Cu2+ transporter
MFDGKRCLVGSLKLIDFEQANMSTQILERSLSWKDKPISTVFFAIDGQVIAAFALGDSVRPTSKAFIDSIKKLGVKPVVLSGDNESAVSKVAMELGIKEYLGGQSPEEKAQYIVRLQATGNVVAMLGDGVNDAVALTQSDVGIAMGSGSDIAMESAGITLIHSDPQHVVKALRLSRGTIKTIRTNLFWAFIYNIISIPIAAGVLYPINGFLLHPMIAGAAMSLSSVSVLLNSLRLKKIKI